MSSANQQEHRVSTNRPHILVTGAAGFIGSHAAQQLLARGYHVVGIDNFSDFYDRSWKELNLASISSGERIDVEEIDITNGTAIDALVGKIKPVAILHLAAMAGVRPSIEQPAYYARVNVEGTTHLLQAAVSHGVGKFVFASSSSVYGNLAKVPFSENDPVGEPISPYAATKRAGELLCYTFWHLYKLPIFCLRFFTVYGPRQRPDLAIHKFTRLISAGQPLPFFGDGSTSRDYTFVDDIVDGIMKSLDRCDRYRVYNLGGSSPVTLLQLIEELERAIGKKAILDKRPAQLGDVERTFADLSRAQSELGYQPKTTLAEGLRKFVGWYKEYGHLYRLPGDKA
ncbi:MAG TPA: SDR family NAD(P)-dependent oxidoreductase [Tepidisphaeraceae bacterium]|jgi:UDP-glucuronate 4-epimerase|nr:SDR family NAD(P)-dependent oxidoreductase [Tepidisphaeraceae bacterium]